MGPIPAPDILSDLKKPIQRRSKQLCPIKQRHPHTEWGQEKVKGQIRTSLAHTISPYAHTTSPYTHTLESAPTITSCITSWPVTLEATGKETQFLTLSLQTCDVRFVWGVSPTHKQVTAAAANTSWVSVHFIPFSQDEPRIGGRSYRLRAEPQDCVYVQTYKPRLTHLR